MVENSALGITSLVLGIIAIVTIVFPLIFPSFIFGILAVTFAITTQTATKHRAYKKETKLILIGFILGVINLIISILTLLK